MRIKIGHRFYEVEEADSIINDHGRALRGQIDHMENEIKYLKGMPPIEVATTLVHEALHGIYSFGDVEVEEGMVVYMGNMLTALIAENPDLIKLVQESFDVAVS